MSVKPALIEKLAQLIVSRLQAHDSVTFKADPAAIRAKVRDIITKNFTEEEEIEKEAREMLASHATGSQAVDQHRMFLLIKQRLAQQRGFIL